ncbi:MAG: ribosomal protein L7/L12 [Anaerolineae bacterium]|nr:ribosomal protein L7/L12 [Anaerolineae bacterium]
MSYTDSEIFALKQRVAKLERQVTFLLRSSGLRYVDEPPSGVSPEILDLVQRGQKIRAIKLYREETGVGLREAKDFIDSLDA